MTVREIFKSLNDYQYNAVVDETPSILLNACVGSGKTTVLISKIGYLYLTHKYNNDEVMCLTFTNKAANEIKERIKNNKYLENIELTYCNTFHSVALKLLQESNIEDLGYKKDFTIITPEEEQILAELLVKENNLKVKYLNKLSKRFELLKNNIKTYGIMKKEDDIERLKELLQFEKKKENIMSFDDLIENVTKLNLKDKLNLKYIIIDEFQDTNIQQLDFIESIKNKDTKIFVVGDRNQTIYSFRGSELNIFDTYKEMYNAKEMILPINYRSNENILEVARKVLVTDKIKGLKKSTNKIIINNHYDEFNEADYLSDSIKKHIKNNIPYKDIAILYRTRKQSKILEDVFNKNNIPYKVFKRKADEEDEIKTYFISLLKVLINPKDILSLKNIYQNEKYGFNKSDIYIRNMIDKNIDEFYEQIKLFIEKSKNTTKINLLEEYLKTINFDIEDKKEIDKYLIELKEILKENHDLYDSIIKYINNSKLYVEKEIKEDKVNLMTLHASKGLEFKVVYIIGANQGLIPLLGKKEDKEEEKRLFFVGITRAKDILEISYYNNPSIPGVKKDISEFLTYIPDSLVTHIKKDNKSNNLKDLRKLLNTNIEEKKQEKKMIEHEKYGVGEVIEENDITIKVNFEKYGEKEFVKAFEKITYK